MLNRKRSGWFALLLVLLLSAIAHAASPNPDVMALVQLGPRVAGTAAAEKASQYLVTRYRQAGYETELQPFSYPKFTDLGSSLTLGDRTIEAVALNGSIPGTVTGTMVAIPNTGRPEDYAAVARGAIALVQRGGLSFSEKIQHAANAGAQAIVILNNQPGIVRGTLTETSKIPAVTLSQEQGKLLTRSTSATLRVNTRLAVQARNVIAHRKGVTQPSLIIGAHFDSAVESPGANDNASGTAVLLAIARQFAQTPLAQKIWFISFDGEEDGLQGAKSFVQSVPPEFLQRLKGMVNFDMVGVNEQLAIEASSTLKSFAKLPPNNPPAYLMGSSDHAWFKTKQVPILFFYRGMEPNYHKPTDQAADPRLIQNTKDQAITVIKQIL
jgi:Zn-dependent M28 family amino/carboxypeptidase